MSQIVEILSESDDDIEVIYSGTRNSVPPSEDNSNEKPDQNRPYHAKRQLSPPMDGESVSSVFDESTMAALLRDLKRVRYEQSLEPLSTGLDNIGAPVDVAGSDNDSDLEIVGEIQHDELEMLDEAAVDKTKFKSVTFHSSDEEQEDAFYENVFNNANHFNQPAPVPHFGGDYQLPERTAPRLAHPIGTDSFFEDEIATKKAEVERYGISLAKAQQSMDHLQLKLDSAQNEDVDSPETNDKIELLMSQLKTQRNRISAIFMAISSANNMVSSYISKLQQSTAKLHNQGGLSNESDTKGIIPLRQGYSRNVYSSAEDQNLKDLLNSIKPEEEDTQSKDSMPTPPNLTVSLMKHQKLGLHWLLKKEESPQRGSILADAMGLGKTVEAISLIISNLPKKTDPNKAKTTLIVAPVSLLQQWQAEIKTKVKSEANLSAVIYHGAAKKDLYKFKLIAKHDILLTSYGTLASEFKKHFRNWLSTTKSSSAIPRKDDGGDGSYISPLYEGEFHRIILDEAHIIKNKSALASRATSTVDSVYRLCLTGTPMQNSIDELYPLIRFLRIRPYNDEERFSRDMIIPLKKKDDSEGDHDTQVQDMAMKRVQTLLRAVLLRRTKDTLIDGEPVLQLPKKTVEEVYVDLGEDSGYYKELEERSKTKVMKIMKEGGIGSYSSFLTLLLRLRQACCHQYLVRIGETGNDIELNYKQLEQEFASARSLSPATIDRIKRDIDNLSQEDGEFNSTVCPVCFEVPVSSEIMLLNPCGHLLCRTCVNDFFENSEDSDELNIGQRVRNCEVCKVKCSEDKLISYQMFDWVCNQHQSFSTISDRSKTPQISKSNQVKKIISDDGGFSISPKVNKCVELIDDIIKKDPTSKVLVFSSFTLLFDVMDFAFKDRGIDYLRYDGSMTMDTRNNVIKEFYQTDKKVLVISLRSGNVGLTLTCANHVIIMDPFWNPFVEEQAQDRAHRIGQQREVHIYRILTTKTVEERIMILQQKKKDLVSTALDGMKSASSLGRQELAYLFNLGDMPN